MIEKVQRANGYGFTLRLGLWLLGMVMVLLAPTTGKASSFDGQYHGTFSGDGSGSITFSVTGGVVSGSVSGSWDGASISGKFSGSVSADGRMATELSGTIHTAPRSWLETVDLDAKFEPGPFSGSITGTLAASGISSDPSDPVSTSASGTWYASA